MGKYRNVLGAGGALWIAGSSRTFWKWAEMPLFWWWTVAHFTSMEGCMRRAWIILHFQMYRLWISAGTPRLLDLLMSTYDVLSACVINLVCLCQQRNMKRNGNRSCVTRKTRFGSREREWLKGDTQRGCLCLYGGTVDPQPPTPGPQSSSTPQTDLQLVLCSTSTTVEELCAQRNGHGLYVQLHGDLIR